MSSIDQYIRGAPITQSPADDYSIEVLPVGSRAINDLALPILANISTPEGKRGEQIRFKVTFCKNLIGEADLKTHNSWKKSGTGRKRRFGPDALLQFLQPPFPGKSRLLLQIDSRRKGPPPWNRISRRWSSRH